MSKHRRRPRQSGFARPELPKEKRREKGVGAVHPNSMAARKWGRRTWDYRG